MTVDSLTAVTDLIAASQDDDRWVVTTCRHTETALAAALQARDVPMIAEIRVGAEDTHARTMRERMPRHVQLTAAAAVRLAERTLALAIRAGQAAGEIRRLGDNRPDLPGPADVASIGARSGLSAIYSLADDVSDDEFLAAIAACRDDHVMSRAALIRKLEQFRLTSPGRAANWLPDVSDHSPAAIERRHELIGVYAGQGHTSRQIAQTFGQSEETVRRAARELGIAIQADQVVARTRRFDSARVARETVTTLEALADGTGLVDMADVDPVEAATWVESLTDSLRRLSQFAKQMKELSK